MTTSTKRPKRTHTLYLYHIDGERYKEEVTSLRKRDLIRLLKEEIVELLDNSADGMLSHYDYRSDDHIVDKDEWTVEEVVDQIRDYCAERPQASFVDPTSGRILAQVGVDEVSRKWARRYLKA